VSQGPHGVSQMAEGKSPEAAFDPGVWPGIAEETETGPANASLRYIYNQWDERVETQSADGVVMAPSLVTVVTLKASCSLSPYI